MPSRREFIHSGMVVSAFAMNGLVPQGADATGAPSGRTIRLQRAVYDSRYEAARRFGAVAAARGVPVRELAAGDVTEFWYDELDLLWRQERAAIAGTTAFGPMFALERLAAERGLQTVLRVEHRAGEDGSLLHYVTATEATLATAAELVAARLDWPAAMALLAGTCAFSAGPERTVVLRALDPLPGPTAPTPLERRAHSIVHYYTPLAVQQGYGVALDASLYTWVLASVEARLAPLAPVRS